MLRLSNADGTLATSPIDLKYILLVADVVHESVTRTEFFPFFFPHTKVYTVRL